MSMTVVSRVEGLPEPADVRVRDFGDHALLERGADGRPVRGQGAAGIARTQRERARSSSPTTAAATARKRSLEQHGARVIEVERKGYGHALRAGIQAARGRYIVMGDSDDSYDFSALEPFVERLRAGYDLVMGNRFRGGIRPGAMPWLHRYVGNPILTGILNLFFRTPIGDAHCGLRAFRKDSYAKLGLASPGMEFASEMVVKACVSHQKITEVPIVLHPDGRDRPPHLRSFRDGWRHLRYMLMCTPRFLFIIPGLVLTLLGLAAIPAGGAGGFRSLQRDSWVPISCTPPRWSRSAGFICWSSGFWLSITPTFPTPSSVMPGWSDW